MAIIAFYGVLKTLLYRRFSIFVRIAFHGESFHCCPIVAQYLNSNALSNKLIPPPLLTIVNGEFIIMVSDQAHVPYEDWAIFMG